MSLEDRIRQSFAAAIDEARGKLDAELASTLASVREESAREREAAVAEARSAVEAEFARRFDDEKADLVNSHDRALVDLRHAAESTLAAARHDADAALEAARADAERGQMEIGRLLQQAEAHAAALRDADSARLRPPRPSATAAGACSTG